MTLGEMRLFLGYRLGWGPNPNAHLISIVDVAINKACRRVHGRRNWDWLYTTAQIKVPAVTTAKYWVDLPSDCRGVVAVAMLSNGRPLESISLEVDEVQWGKNIQYLASSAPGIPQRYCARKGRLYLLPPAASAGDTAVVAYIIKHVPLTLATDEPAWPSDYHDIAVDMALAELSSADEFSQRVASEANKNAKEGMSNMHGTGSEMQQVVQRFRHLIGQH